MYLNLKHAHEVADTLVKTEGATEMAIKNYLGVTKWSRGCLTMSDNFVQKLFHTASVSNVRVFKAFKSRLPRIMLGMGVGLREMSLAKS